MPKIASCLHNTFAGHFIFVFDMCERDSARSSGTVYHDGPPPHGRPHVRDDVLVADTGHRLWPELVRHGVSEHNSSVPSGMLLTFESVELLDWPTALHQMPYDALYLTLYVGDQPQARFSVAHLMRAKAPLRVRRGPREVTVPPRQHHYWEMQRHTRTKGHGHGLFHVAVEYSTRAYEADAP